MDEFADMRLTELRDDPTHVRMVAQRFRACKNFAQQPNADVGYTLFSIPALH